MKVQANTIRPGHVIEHGGKQWSVLKSNILQPGKGGAFVQVEMRDVKSGLKSNDRFRTQETVEKLMVDEKSCTFLYRDETKLTLMDTETYEQFEVDAATLSVSQLAALHMLLNASNLSNGERRARALSVLGGMDVLIFGENIFGG